MTSASSFIGYSSNSVVAELHHKTGRSPSLVEQIGNLEKCTIPALETRNLETANWTIRSYNHGLLQTFKKLRAVIRPRLQNFTSDRPLCGFGISGFQCGNRAFSRFPI